MFIAFEGLDGSGSSTQARILTERLEANGKPALQTKEPTNNTHIGKMIREILQNKWKCSPAGLQLLFSADRAEHLKNEIEPAIKNGRIVITDRYFFSTIAYGSLQFEDWAWLKSLSRHFPVPDITFLFKLDPAVCIERIAGRGSDFELFEQHEKLEKIWLGYERLSREYQNIRMIDASKSIDEISEEIWNIVKVYI